MSHSSSQYVPLLIPPSSPSAHSSPATTADAHPHHDDFLGTPSQDSPYQLHDALGLLNFDSYPYTLAEDHISPDLLTDNTVARSDHIPSTWSSPQYPHDSLLFATTPYPNEVSLPSTSSHPFHDSYFDPHNPNPMYGTPTYPAARQHVPRIRVETEFPTASPHYMPHPSYTPSPLSGRSPTAILPTPSHMHSSPSSTGSAPPITPETPFASPHPSPFIQQSSHSPISPSCISVATVAFDPKEAYSPVPREPGNVLQLAQAAGHYLGGPFVPQKTYRPHTLSDRRRYVEEVHLEHPIMFITSGPAGCGILLRDALTSKFSSLVDRDDAMFEGRGPSVSIRLNWPGYAPWSRQIPTRDFRSPPHPITRAKLAKNVAKIIQRFIQDMETQPMEDASEGRWRVGSRHIKLEDLMLVGLQHVSMGSWQAHVRLVRRS